MIGVELLNLLHGDPSQALMQATVPQPAPNPNPGAPPPPTGAPGSPPGPPPAPGGATPRSMPAMAPVGPPAPGAAPPQPLPQSGPPSTATQSPPDLATLYMRMIQQQRSADEIDRGLANIAGAYAAPGTQNAVMAGIGPPNRGGQDPGSAIQQLMQLQYLQQMQGMAAPTGVDPAIWRAAPPDMKAKIIDQAAAAGIELNKAGGQASIDVAKQGTEEKQKDLLEAQDKAPNSLQQMNDMDNVANQLKGPLNSALTSIVASSSARIAAEKLLETDPAKEPGDAMRQVYAGMLSSDQLAALNQLKKLDAQIYGDAFQSTGSRRTQQEVANLKSGISTLKNFNQSPDAYMSQFNDFQNQLHKTMANTYGAAGRVDEIPDAIKWDMSNPNAPKPLVDSAYLPNGNKYGGSGGQWANNPPKSNFDYASIPSGTVYTAPDGTQRKKP